LIVTIHKPQSHENVDPNTSLLILCQEDIKCMKVQVLFYY